MDKRWKDARIALGDIPYSRLTDQIDFWIRPSNPWMPKMYNLQHKSNYMYMSPYFPLLF